MSNKRRQNGESIKQWLSRLKFEQNNISGGELEPSYISAPRYEIKSDRRVLGQKTNDRRVNQDAPIQRKFVQDPSLAERALNSITDALHITKPPTYTDGYGRVLNAETPLWESAHGKELKRAGKTAATGALIATIPFIGAGLTAETLPSTLGSTAGSLGSYALIKTGLNKLNDNLKNVKLSPEQINGASFIPSVLGGLGASQGINFLKAKNWVNPEDLIYIGAPFSVVKQAEKWGPSNYDIMLDRVKHALLKPKFRVKLKGPEYEIGSFIDSGAEARVFTNASNPNTVLKIQDRGLVVPSGLEDGNITGSTIKSAAKKGRYLSRIKNRGAYTVPQKLVGLEEQTNGRYAPIFEQPKMYIILGKDHPQLTDKQARNVLTTLFATQSRYKDTHFGNIAFDGKNAWLIDNQKMRAPIFKPVFSETAPKRVLYNETIDNLNFSDL